MSRGLLSPALVERLLRMRVSAGGPRGRHGSGLRLAADKGQGMDFADHRRYEAGDDLRHLDVAAYARLREPFVRVYHPQRPLDLTVLVDASASMGFGRPSKLRFAQRLAAGLACAALGGIDRVRLCVSRSGRIHLSRGQTSSARLDDLLRWLEGFDAGRGADSLDTALEQLVPRLPHGGLTVVLSDFLQTSNPRDRFVPLAARNQELIALQILDPDEASPKPSPGETELVDSETGESLELALEEEALARYRHELSRLQDAVRASTEVVRGRFHVLATDVAPEELFARELPRLGILS